MTKKNINAKLQVIMITYNHAEFIAKAIEGILMQICDFDIELIIADDNSPDNTEDVVKNIISSHPNGSWINYTKHKQNKGVMSNLTWALKKINAKYLALCEGDDYWTDPYKLKKQVDFLESNSDFSMVFHAADILENDVIIDDFITVVPKKITTTVDLLNGNYLYTFSVVYETTFLKNLPSWIENVVNGDITLHILASKYGPIMYLDEKMGVYRIHNYNSYYHQRFIYKATEWQRVLIYLLDEFEGELKEVLRSKVFSSMESVKHNYLMQTREYESLLTSRFLKPFVYVQKIIRNYRNRKSNKG